MSGESETRFRFASRRRLRRGGLVRRSFLFLVLAAGTTGLSMASAVAASASQSGSVDGAVLPPSAKPHGTSLTEMVSKTALFQSSLNAGNQPGNPINPPKTPFQILYTYVNSTNHFQVRTGTFFYVPVVNFDDSPPVQGCVQPGVAGTPGCTGVWPENNLEARSYLFDPSKCHGHDLSITVDGVTTLLGPNYLAGPVTTPPLLDTSVPGVFGTHMFFVARVHSSASARDAYDHHRRHH